MMELIKNRHSKRAFLNEPVKRSVLERIFAAASHAGSSKNTQPWKVAIVTGNTKNQLISAMCEKFDAEKFDGEDYTYMIDPMPLEFR